MTTHRAFLAIDLDQYCRDQIAPYIKQLAQLARQKVRWLPPDHWHITLRFLGNITQAQEDQLITAIDNTLKKFNPFEIEFHDQLLFFPADQPKVTALKTTPVDPFLKWIKIIDESLEKLAFPIEQRAYIPHLTIARHRNIFNPKSLQQAAHQKIITAMPAEQLTLFHSQLEKTGPVYTAIKRWAVS